MKSYVSGLAKNRIKKSTGYFTGFLFLLIVMVSGQKACAAVTVGEPGKTYSGEYVVIVNAGTDATESTGTLTFTEGESGQNQTAQTSGNVALQSTGVLADYEAEYDRTESVTRYADSAATTYEIGSQRMFYTYSGYRTFTCIGVGEHCYIWMENNLKTSYDTAGKTSLIASDMAQTYEQGAYETLKEISGGTIPCRDGSGKLSIALEQISSASGVYMGKGNEPDITAIHINAKTAAEYTTGSMRTTNALLVHEGQHALFEQFTSYDYTQNYMGINEGLSLAAMEYAWGNSDSSKWLSYIKENHEIQNGSALLYRSYRNNTAQDYGLPYLFLRYLINRKSGEYDLAVFCHAAYAVNASDKTAASYLQAVMGSTCTFEDLATDFYTAIAANEASGKYGFEGDAVVQSALNQYPYYVGGSGSEVSLEQTAAIILHLGEGGTFTVPDNGGSHIRYRIVGEKNSTLRPLTGSGTAEDPYQIVSVKDWNQMANQPNAHYKLMNDLNVNGKAVTMIGTFSGELNGNGYCVTGLKQPICDTNSGTICNLKVKANAAGIARNDYGLIANTNDGTIRNCLVSGKITLASYGDFSIVGTAIGGIVGRNNVAGTVQNCTVSAKITITAPSMISRNGGIVGINSGSVKKCYFRGTLTVTQNDEAAVVYAGGIAGETNRDYGLGGRVAECLNEGSILAKGGKSSAGQICGNVAQNIVNYGINTYIASCYGKSNGLPLIGSQESAKLNSSKVLTDEQWKDQTSFSGIDFDSDWKMGDNGPTPSGIENIEEWDEKEEDGKKDDQGSGSDGNQDGGNKGDKDVNPGGGTTGDKDVNPGSGTSDVKDANPGGGSENNQAENSAVPTQTMVKLNATSLPLQVKKSTSVLKLKEWSAGDTIASWSSSNKKVAIVNSRTGKITAKKTGKTTITLTMRSGATAKCLVKVQKGKVRTKKIKVSKTVITLKKGEKYSIVWEKQPLTSSDKVSFKSAKKKIASVSGKGVITAKKKGTTYITVKSGSKKCKIKVTVR